MDDATRKALEESIAHWDRIVKNNGIDTGEKCALCEVFGKPRDGEYSCSGCPVFELTKKQYCAGTPFSTWFKAQNVGTSARKRAQAELNFLKSLLKSPTAKIR